MASLLLAPVNTPQSTPGLPPPGPKRPSLSSLPIMDSRASPRATPQPSRLPLARVGPWSSRNVRGSKPGVCAENWNRGQQGDCRRLFHRPAARGEAPCPGPPTPVGHFLCHVGDRKGCFLFQDFLQICYWPLDDLRMRITE